MKVSYLLFVLVVFHTQANAQTPPQSGSKFIYCELIGAHTVNFQRINLFIDFGEVKNSLNDEEKEEIKKSVKEFKSIVDGLNYMQEKGWEFVQVYSYGDNYNRFIFRKKENLSTKER